MLYLYRHSIHFFILQTRSPTSHPPSTIRPRDTHVKTTKLFSSSLPSAGRIICSDSRLFSSPSLSLLLSLCHAHLHVIASIWTPVKSALGMRQSLWSHCWERCRQEANIFIYSVCLVAMGDNETTTTLAIVHLIYATIRRQTENILFILWEQQQQ